MPLVTLDAERRARAQHNGSGPPIRAESDVLGGFRRTDGQRPTRSDSAIWLYASTRKGCAAIVAAT
jgi:hypothetical protein